MIRIAPSEDIAACQALRRAVFMDEQNVSEADEFDGLDGAALHLLATRDGVPVGTARLMVSGDTGKIGRVCVLREARGLGLGAALIEAALAEFRAMDWVERATLGAQISALGFYEKLGFVAHGPEFDDAGIPHRQMSREL